MTIDRRTFVGAAATLAAMPAYARAADDDDAPAFPSRRPPEERRNFTSKAVEREIERVKGKIADPKLAWMFENAYPNTLDTTVKLSSVGGRPDSFVITGDIPCLWLRDSAAQLKPYLHLVRKDPKLGELFRGLIGRHARSILIDPYANAFMEDPKAKTSLAWAVDDDTEMRPGVAERKWEVDSLCYALRFAYLYWKEMRDPRPFDLTWAKSARLIVRTFREQQRKDGNGPYRFQRLTKQPHDSLPWGWGNPTRPVGLIHSGFRPSDDACLYPFLIPANMFAVITLRELVVVATEAAGDLRLAAEAKALSDEVEKAIQQHGKMRLRDGREVWAYEVDGFGNAVFMDDANVPSLSALGYLGCVPREDPLWRRTEAAAWSEANPYFFRGAAAEGIGGPHIGRGQIWPMSLIVRALSAYDDTTVRSCLKLLRDTDGGTGFVHEAFDQDDPAKFTRGWFAWANGLFGELIVKLADERPHILGTAL